MISQSGWTPSGMPATRMMRTLRPVTAGPSLAVAAALKAHVRTSTLARKPARRQALRTRGRSLIGAQQPLESDTGRLRIRPEIAGSRDVEAGWRQLRHSFGHGWRRGRARWRG